MATAIVRHSVTDFTSWKAFFDGAEEMRRQAGMTAWNIYTTTGDDTDVTAVLEFGTLTQAQAHFADPNLQAAMQQAGVNSKPEITFLDPR